MKVAFKLFDSIIDEVTSFEQIHQPEAVDNPLIEPLISHNESTRSLTSSPSILNQSKDLIPDAPS